MTLREPAYEMKAAYELLSTGLPDDRGVLKYPTFTMIAGVPVYLFDHYYEKEPRGVHVWANPYWLARTDDASVGGLTIISKRSLAVLDGVGVFERRLLPVFMYTHPKWCTARLEPPWLTPPPRGRTRVASDAFVAVAVPELDVIDWSETEYSTWSEEKKEEALWRREGKRVPGGHFSEPYRLVAPEGGLPPLFRPRGGSGLPHVTGVARRALDEAGIVFGYRDPIEVVSPAQAEADAKRRSGRESAKRPQRVKAKPKGKRK